MRVWPREVASEGDPRERKVGLSRADPLEAQRVDGHKQLRVPAKDGKWCRVSGCRVSGCRVAEAHVRHVWVLELLARRVDVQHRERLLEGGGGDRPAARLGAHVVLEEEARERTALAAHAAHPKVEHCALVAHHDRARPVEDAHLPHHACHARTRAARARARRRVRTVLRSRRGAHEREDTTTT